MLMSRVAKHKAREIVVSDPGLIGLYFQYRRLVSDDGLRILGVSAKTLGLSEDYQFHGFRYDDSYVPSDHVASVGRLDASFYLQNLLLRDSDVFGMANSLEIRVPFLDRDFVEWAFSLPGELLLPRRAPLKYLLREMCSDLYTEEQARQPKRGFTIPLAAWMQGSLREITEENLLFLRNSMLVDPAGVETLQKNFRDQPHGPFWSRIWALVTLGHWLRRHLATRPPAVVTAQSA